MAVRKRKKARAPVKVAADEVAVIDRDEGQDRAGAASFPIVGVGASAGGIEAFTDLLRALPEHPGAAIVLVQHQEPAHASMLVHILARATRMVVKSIASDEQIEKDIVYVAPAEGQLLVQDGVLRLVSMIPTTMPIDNFFRSLAEDQGSRAVGVVLSGAASDGAAGTKVIKAEGGVTFAQDESAKFDSMPKSAIASGSVDFVLAPREIAKEIVRIGQKSSGSATAPLSTSEMDQVFGILRRSYDVDFTNYKSATIERRVRRRMAAQKVNTLSRYLDILRRDHEEVDQLYGDMLIRVTGFFRDADVYETLKNDIFPALMKNRKDHDAVRVWVPGCATGEEVYSLAMALLEYMSVQSHSWPIQIFGTDISESAVAHARSAVYSAAQVSEVSDDRLQRFFTKTNGSYRVAADVRDCCIFARQNLTKDPPFSKLDLVSCRNVMIYLEAVLQRKIVSIFHYALRPNGYLLLGSSESIGSFGDLFNTVDRKHRIYQKKASASRTAVVFEALPQRAVRQVRVRSDKEPAPPHVFREADRAILNHYAPAGVLINENMDILQFRGRTSAFLEPPPGAASLNILKMARGGLLAELRSAIQAARKLDEPVRRDGIRLKTDGTIIVVNVEVIPFTTQENERYQLVLFEQSPAPPEEKQVSGKRRKGKRESPASHQMQRLKRELDATREYLQSIIEEHEIMNEELRSANDEIQSTNEELQSTNEELETAKEELQSTNEELITLNEELENRNEELGQTNNDLMNLLTSVDMPIIMLDDRLKIRRFNPGAERALNLASSDLGRPVADIRSTLQVEDLDSVIGSVIGTLDMRELEVHDRSGKSYSLRIRPYKTVDNKIEGAVLVLTEKEGRGGKS